MTRDAESWPGLSGINSLVLTWHGFLGLHIVHEPARGILPNLNIYSGITILFWLDLIGEARRGFHEEDSDGSGAVVDDNGVVNPGGPPAKNSHAVILVCSKWREE